MAGEIEAKKKELEAGAKELQAQMAFVRMQQDSLEERYKVLKEQLMQGEATYQALVSLEAAFSKSAEKAPEELSAPEVHHAKKGKA